VTGDPVGGGQSGDGDKRKGRPTAQLETAISGQSKGPAPQPGPDQIESAAPTKKPALAALEHVWRGVRHTKLTDWLIITLTAVIAYSTWSSDTTFGRQLGVMKAQLKAMNDSTPDTKKLVQANEDLATAMKQQAANTGALVTQAGISASAAQRSAAAELRVATAEEAARRPAVGINDFSLTGFGGAPQKDGRTKITVTIHFNNTGQGTLSQTISKFNLYFVHTLPDKPPNITPILFGAYDGAMPHGAVFGPSEPFEYLVSPGDTKAVLSGLYNVFIFGEVDYSDVSQIAHRWCYAEVVRMKGGQSQSISTTGGPAYHCNT
jgi:hypothetical protein